MKNTLQSFQVELQGFVIKKKSYALCHFDYREKSYALCHCFFRRNLKTSQEKRFERLTTDLRFVIAFFGEILKRHKRHNKNT
jgi:hypothetical protein